MSNSEGKDKGGSIKETKEETKNKDESDNQLGGSKEEGRANRGMEEEGEEAHEGEGWGELGLSNIQVKENGGSIKETKHGTNKKNESNNILGGGGK